MAEGRQKKDKNKIENKLSDSRVKAAGVSRVRYFPRHPPLDPPLDVGMGGWGGWFAVVRRDDAQLPNRVSPNGW